MPMNRPASGAGRRPSRARSTSRPEPGRLSVFGALEHGSPQRVPLFAGIEREVRIDLECLLERLLALFRARGDAIAEGLVFQGLDPDLRGRTGAYIVRTQALDGAVEIPFVVQADA